MSKPAFYYDADRDTNDGKKWSEMDLEDLAHHLRHGGTIETAAELLGRQGTVEEVRRRAQDLGLC